MDVTELKAFYARPIGSVVRRLVAHRLRARWQHVKGSTVVGLGFASPYLGMFRDEAGSASAFMPAAQGALVWPAKGPVHAVLVDEAKLPLPDACVDRLLAVHCLETSEHVRPLLREMWRVLKPEGRLMLVVPNRRSIWARFESTPFGHGHPYSRGQLERLLNDAMFSPVGWSGALHMPPIEFKFMLRSAPAWERLGIALTPGFAGVIISESQKETMAPIGTKTRRIVLPEMVAVPGRTAKTERRCDNKRT